MEKRSKGETEQRSNGDGEVFTCSQETASYKQTNDAVFFNPFGTDFKICPAIIVIAACGRYLYPQFELNGFERKRSPLCERRSYFAEALGI